MESLQLANDCFPSASVVGHRPEVFDGVMGWGIHQKVSCVSHVMLSDKRLVHNAIRTCPNYMPYPTETCLSYLLEQVEACRERASFGWDWSVCDAREHCTVGAIDPAHCGCVEVPCLTPIGE